MMVAADRTTLRRRNSVRREGEQVEEKGRRKRGLEESGIRGKIRKGEGCG